MTREEQKNIRELTQTINQYIKKDSKRFGFKSISGIAYKIVNHYLYELLISVPPIDCGSKIEAAIYFKPLILDEVFWDVFKMKEEAEKQPFSFHITGAFTPYCDTIATWKVAITPDLDVYQILYTVFVDANSIIQQNSIYFTDLIDFKNKICTSNNPIQRLNYILCEIALENYQKALELITLALQNNDMGLFASSDGVDIIEHAKKYCENKVLSK